MSKYYFDVRQDGDLATDDDGVEILARSNVRSEALAYLGEIAREVISADEECGLVSLEVRDARGLVMIASVNITIKMKR